MKVNQSSVVWGLAGLAGAYLVGKWIIKDAGGEVSKAAGKVGAAINPTSSDNIFYRGVNSIGAAVTGRQDFNLGVWTYDILHPDQAAGMMGPLVIRPAVPPEASTTPNAWQQDTPGPSARAPVTKSRLNQIQTR